MATTDIFTPGGRGKKGGVGRGRWGGGQVRQRWWRRGRGLCVLVSTASADKVTHTPVHLLTSREASTDHRQCLQWTIVNYTQKTILCTHTPSIHTKTTLSLKEHHNCAH